MNKLTVREKQRERTAYLSLIPIIFVLLFLKGIPMIIAIVESFFTWDGAYKNVFSGLKNYRNVFGNEELMTMLKNSVFLLLHIPIQLFLAFIFSMFIYESVPGAKVYRAIYYIPHVTSVVIIGILFRNFFRMNGIVNRMLEKVGLGVFTIDWLADGSTGLWVIMFAMIWQSLGWQMLIISGGLSSMDPQVLESAKIDGANYWQRLFKVIIPLQSRTIEYSVVVSIIWVFSGLYTFIYTITGGGPGYSTTTLDYMVYLKAFTTTGKMGLACAYAVVLLIIVLILVAIQRRLMDKVSDWE